jgi:hypothetical protein
VRRTTILIGLGSGLEGWLSIELDSLTFIIGIEDGKRSVETSPLPS